MSRIEDEIEEIQHILDRISSLYRTSAWPSSQNRMEK
jgi:hypothetical protein